MSEDSRSSPDDRRVGMSDPEHIRRVWSDHRRWVAAVLLAHKPNGVDLEDLLQEVAVTLVERAHEIRDPDKLKPWLRTVAVNAARTSARRAGSRLRLVRDDAPTRTQPDPASEHALLRSETASTLNHALELAQRLPPDYREPLLLRSVRGLSQRQIAQILGLPETTVETRLARARRMLREEMEFEEDLASTRVGRASDSPPHRPVSGEPS